MRLHVVDEDGVPVSFRVAEFALLPPLKGQDLAPHFRNGAADNVALGQYRYRLEPAEPQRHGAVFGSVYLMNRGERWLTLLSRTRQAPGTTISESELVPGASRGVIEGVDLAHGDTWVRLYSAYEDRPVVEEVPVHPDGSFVLQDKHDGKYIVAVYHGGDVVYVGTIKMKVGLPRGYRIHISPDKH